MRTAVLVVSFGTMQEAAWDQTLGKIEEEIRREGEGQYDVFTAYTSRRVAAYWRSRGKNLLNEEEAFACLRRRDYEKVAVLPTHLAAGHEFAKLKQQAEEYSACFKKLVLGVPLLEGAVYRERLARALKEEIVPEEGELLVLMAHGMRSGEHLVYDELEQAFNADGRGRAAVVTMENKELRAIKAARVKKLVLAPLLLTTGRHVLQDMCGTGEESWQGFLEANGYAVRTVAKGLGEYPKVRAIYRQQLRELYSFR